MTDFAHLHVHTEYSLLDGACRLGPLVARAKELGQKSLAITDHGAMYGVIDFYRECKKQDIRPVIGCEVYVAPRTRFDKEHKVDSSPHHLVLLCKDNGGYQNLIKLVSLAYIEGFYSKPRVDRALLEQYHEGLICLSACLAGEVPRALSARDYDRARETALWYRDLFGAENYFLELQDHGLPEQKDILPLLAKLSRDTGIPLVCTNDSHYLRREDAAMQKVLVCISTNTTVLDPSDMEFETEEFYLKSGDEMQALFGAYGDAVQNTVRIAERCRVDFTFGEIKLPFFTAPDGRDNLTYFRSMCEEGLARHYGQSPDPAVRRRLEYEIGVISSMGYVDYYLIVHDFIAYARSRGIPVGPGRGSGAGSLAAYCIGITGIDPIKYALLFERFLNPERISMPDFDIDFCYERRQEVIDYVVDKYGSDHVAQIITFGTMAARGAIRDVGRALGMSYAAVDVIAKAVPFELGMTLARALEVSEEFRGHYDADPQNRDLIDMARKLEGMARHASTHAAGVVITRDPADTYVPLQKTDQSIVTQFPMGTLEELGLLKMDFLGLRTLTVISHAQEMINRAPPGDTPFDIEKIPLDDPGVFEMLSHGQTGGVFQFESSGMRNVLVQLKPEHMEDLIAVISLYRPGPMESIPRYVRNRHHPELVTYKTPQLESILKVTYGCIVYQEQVMQICRELAGYSYGRADLVRRAMSKKKHDVMEKERQAFIHGQKNDDGTVECPGCVANGIPAPIANEIFDEMSSFASYAFNKSHAAAYALLSYQTAYLRLHHPREFFAALLTSVLDFTEKVTDYIAEAKKLGIAVLPPDIQESGLGFTVVGESIRFGLLAIKNLGRSFIGAVIREREEKPFDGLLDFLQRMHGRDLNRRGVEALIKSGALDRFGHRRSEMLGGYEGLLDGVEATHRNNVEGQLDLFGAASGDGGAAAQYELPKKDEMPKLQLLAFEKETTGLYLSGHPLEQHGDLVDRIAPKAIGKLLSGQKWDGREVRVVGIVASRRLRTTRSNDTMAFVMLEDKTAAIELIVFPRVFSQHGRLLGEGSIVAVSGRVKSADEESNQIVCDTVMSLEDAAGGAAPARAAPERVPPRQDAPPAQAPKTPGRRHGLYLKFPGRDSALVEKASNVLFVFEGGVPVYFYFVDTKQYLKTPRSYWTAPNDVMLGELRRLLGEEGVALID